MTGKECFVAGSSLLMFVFSLLVIATAGFFAGWPIQSGYICLTLLFTAVYTVAVVRHYHPGEARREILMMVGKNLLVCGLLVGAFTLISGLFYDVSYDGQVYHQEAVVQLAEGWNPLTDYMTKNRSNPAMLLNHYAKGPWIYGAALYKTTGHIEQSKAFNWVLMAAGFFLTLAALRDLRRLGRKNAVWLSLIMALNPVTVYQLFSFYIDGQLASLLLCLLALGRLLWTGGDRFAAATMAMVLVLLVNIKFTGVVYGAVAMAMLLGWALLLRRDLVRLLLPATVVGMLVGVLFAGFNPYVTNTVGFGHPFYPLYGRSGATMDIMTTNSPEPFLQMNALEKLAVATFSQSANKVGSEGLPVLKWPFSLSGKELEVFLLGADIRLAGFGPWFSGAVVLALGVVGLGLADRRKRPLTANAATMPGTTLPPDRASVYRGLGVVLCVLLSGLVNPESWWARYSPQYWLVPILLAVLAMAEGGRRLRGLGYALVLVLTVNVMLVATTYVFGNAVASLSFDQGIAEMKETPLTVAVAFREFPARRVILTEKGIEYIRLRPLPELLDIPYADDLAWKQLLQNEAAAQATQERRRRNPLMPAGWSVADQPEEVYFYEVDMRVFLDNCLWAAHLAAGLSEPEH
ncbi:MAG TPA: hypothetical protein VN611_10985 [Patescibacteria group bacterium]|nr:hypothetical protein [Patescibacteria group bacterium]